MCAADAAQVQFWQEARLPAIAAAASNVLLRPRCLFAPRELLHKHIYMHAALIYAQNSADSVLSGNTT